MATHGVRPDTSLGQHFLLDENLADLAVREARLDGSSVVLEVGAGLGTLTVPLARVARWVHAIEIDERLLAALDDAIAGLANVRVHHGDAMRMDLAALRPAPDRLVANLPYHVATPVVLDALDALPTLGRIVVMVQREVAERWLAAPGSRLYGAPSVLLQLATRPAFRRQVGREVFTPRPRVDSTLVAFERVAESPPPNVRAVVRAAFATRRKMLVNALVTAGARRDDVLDALRSLDLSERARAEELPPDAFPALAAALSKP